MSYAEQYIFEGLHAATLLRGRSSSCKRQYFEEHYPKSGEIVYGNKVFDLTHNRFVLAHDIAHWIPRDLKKRYLSLAPVESVARTKATFAVAVVPLEERFRKQADKWRRETAHVSSPSQMMMHPSYQAIMGMAQGQEEEMVRLMLRDLRDNRTPWFWALSYLTHDNPIQRSDAGRLDKMIKAWVDWGKARDKF
jgi:hypothetical protein